MLTHLGTLVLIASILSSTLVLTSLWILTQVVPSLPGKIYSAPTCTSLKESVLLNSGHTPTTKSKVLPLRWLNSLMKVLLVRAPPLDFDGNGTVSARQDILGAYLYTAEGISASQLRAYTHNQNQGTANDMAGTIDALIE